MSDEKKSAAAGGSGIVGMVLPAVLAAAAAFGGAKVAGAHHAAAAPVEHPVEAPKPPGPTLALEPFVVTIPDANKKVHPMKVTIAIEFGPTAKEEELKPLVPRVRDSALSYFRTLTYDEVVDPAASDKIRPEVLERLKTAGTGAERVLITDLVVQ
ncbi:MAG: flagellar basal body-associated FliL family protein [Polyangiaceae bacterium]|jgi:flagellar basal body-associated protein FliL